MILMNIWARTCAIDLSPIIGITTVIILILCGMTGHVIPLFHFSMLAGWVIFPYFYNSAEYYAADQPIIRILYPNDGAGLRPLS